MRKPKRGDEQRGMAAVEFALVLPIFIGMIGFIISVGFGLWVRYQLINHATAAARACALSVPTTDVSVVNCVPGVLQEELVLDPIKLCTVASPVVSVSTQVSSNPNLHMLNVQLSCNMGWDLFTGQKNISYTVTGVSRMPYLLPN